ncbi:MAG: SDR family NAD(P)-dependent oxidoreductase, partial [Proteobacteria bacterium]
MPAQSRNSSKELVVLITGASSGFGFAGCEVFLEKGWKVFAAVRGGPLRQSLFANLQARFPGKLEILNLDLLRRETILDVASRFDNQPLHALINNAGYGLFGAAEDMSEDSLRKQMEVNFHGTVLLTQKLLHALRFSKGSVVTVSSVVGRHALPLTSGYCASKFAVEGFFESLDMEVRPFGVSCYLIEPGTFPTQFGAGIEWAEPLLTSPYREVTVGYENLRRRTFETAKNRSIRGVGELMFHLVHRRPNSLRHPIGPDARATMIAARIVPPNLFHSLARGQPKRPLFPQTAYRVYTARCPAPNRHR